MHHLAFLTRGYGYSHAAKDLSIIEEILAQRQDIRISIASYGKGWEYYASRSIPCVDLGIEDDSDQGAVAELRILHYLMQIQKPDLVVAHEVFFSPSFCHMLGYRNLLLTHWFFSEVGIPKRDRCFHGADALIMLDFAESHHIPVNLNVPVHFTGALARDFKLNKDQARSELGLALDSFVMVGTFGAFIPQVLVDDIQNMVKKLIMMCQAHASPGDHLFLLLTPNQILQNNDFDEETIHWIGVCDRPELFYCAADVVLASATFTALSDLVRNCIPTVGVVAPSDVTAPLHAKFFATTGLVHTASLDTDPEQLWRLAMDVLHYRNSRKSVRTKLEWATPIDVAKIILSYL
jgi:hypothetical protein